LSFTEYRLEPLTMGQVLDRSIRLYRQNFVLFVGIVGLIYVPIMTLHTVLSITVIPAFWEGDTTAEAAARLNIPKFVQSLLVSGIAAVPMARSVAGCQLGRPISIRTAYQNFFALGRRFVTAVLLLLVLFVPVSIYALIPVLGWFSGPGAIVFGFVALAPMIGPIVALEDFGARNTLRRAWYLTRSRFWWLFGLTVGLFFFGRWLIIGPVAVCELIFGILINMIPGLTSDPPTLLLILQLVRMLSRMVGDLLYMPIFLVAMTLAYLDLRMRTEGLDLSLRVAALADAMTSIQMPAASMESNHLVRSKDRIALAILSAAVIGTAVLIYRYPDYFFELFAISGLLQ